MKKERLGKKIAAWLICLAMVLTTINLPAFTTMVHAASWERIDFLISGPASAKFVADESARYMPMATNSEGKITNLPELFTTNAPAENSHYIFDGWYTARDGGEKVTTDTVFTEYTVLYDHWHTEDLVPSKIVKAVTIGNGQLSSNQTITDYNNSSTAPSTGVTGGRDYDIYEGVNASGRKLGDSDRIEAGKSYSVVTTISVEDGYYLGRGVEVYVENGQRANVKYIGSPVKGKYNQWFEGATRLEVCINFPSPTFKYDFTTQPAGGATYNESQYDYTWALSDTPISVSLEQKNDDLWAYIGEATGKTPVYKNCKKTYRLVATYPEGALYSNTFDVTYSEDGKTHDVIWFTTQPQSGRVVNNEDFKYLFALNMEPSIIRVEKKRNYSDEFDYYSGKATGVLSGLDKENRTDTFRLVAYLDGESAYSDEFTVTWYEDSHVCSEGDPEDEVEVLPTCTKDGYYDFTLYCVTCHKEMQKRHIVLPKTDLGHTYGTPVIENITATCGQSGTYEEVEYCLECNNRRWRNTYPMAATGKHTYTKYVSLENGKHKVVCNDCDAVQLGHESDECTFDAGVVTKQPTTTETGIKTYTCADCGYEKTETIEKLPEEHVHLGIKNAQVDATCQAYGVKEYYECSCGKFFTDSTCTKEITDLAAWKSGDGRIEKKEHTLKTTTTKATLTANGKKETKCTVCGKVTKTETIYVAKTIKLSATKYTYDGKVKKPSVTIKDSKGNAIASDGYTVTYSLGRKNVGKYTVKVTFKGNYSGSKNLTFTINPPKTSISKVTAGKKAFTVKWAKNQAQVTGYEIQYSTSSSFAKGNKTVKVTSAKTVSKTISKLTGGKKYYVRIRTYKTVGKTPYYSDWSAKKSVTTKK